MRSYPIQGTQVRVSVPHPYPASIHMSDKRAAFLSVGAKLHGRISRW